MPDQYIATSGHEFFHRQLAARQLVAIEAHCCIDICGGVDRWVVQILAATKCVKRELRRARDISERSRIGGDVFERDPRRDEATELRRRNDGRIAMQRLLTAELEIERLRCHRR